MLREKQVIEIRILSKKGLTNREIARDVFCKSEFPVFARIPNNFPPGKFVNELSLANS